MFDGSTDRFDAGFICIDASFLAANARCEAATWLVRACGAMLGDVDYSAMQASTQAHHPGLVGMPKSLSSFTRWLNFWLLACKECRLFGRMLELCSAKLGEQTLYLVFVSRHPIINNRLAALAGWALQPRDIWGT